MIDAGAWTVLEASEDPFDDRPMMVECSTTAFGKEDFAGEMSFGVNTKNCNYLTVTQPALTDVQTNESIAFRLWHFQLFAVEPAEAHVEVKIGDEVIMDDRIPIPSDSELIHSEAAPSAPIPKGTPVVFHLHNHGSNSWSFLELSRGPPAAESVM